MLGLATKAGNPGLERCHMLLPDVPLLTAYLPVCRLGVSRAPGLAELCDTLLTEILTPEVMEEDCLQLRTNLLLDASTLGVTVRLSTPESREPEGLVSRQEAEWRRLALSKYPPLGRDRVRRPYKGFTRGICA